MSEPLSNGTEMSPSPMDSSGSVARVETTPTAPKDAFRHQWGRSALREAGLFLMLAIIVVLVSGLFLPISWDVYWLLLKLVAGISAGVGALFYLLTVLPRIIYYRLVDLYRRYEGIPEALQRQWTGRATVWGLWVGAVIPALIGTVFLWRGQVQLGFMLIVCAIGVGFSVSWFCISAVIAWIGAIRVAGRTFGLPPAVESPPNARPPTEATGTERPSSLVTTGRAPDNADVVSPAHEQAIKPAPFTDIQTGDQLP